MESVECGSEHPSVEISMAQVSSGVVEDSPPGQFSLQQDNVSETSLLSTGTETEEFVRIDIPSSPRLTLEHVNLFSSTSEVFVGSSSDSNNSSRGLPPKPAYSNTLIMEDAASLAIGGLQFTPSESSFLRSGSLTRQMEHINRAVSVPASPRGVGEQQTILRSRSVPATSTDEVTRDGPIRVLHVVPNRRMNERNSTLSSDPPISNALGEEDQVDITEEEAVCRICLEKFGEELEAFKLECNCRGDIALVHRECCQRWFNLKGNKTCEICKAEVQNIIVMVSRRPAVDVSSLNRLQAQQPLIITAATTETPFDTLIDEAICQQFPILIISSIVGYFLVVDFIQIPNGDDKDIAGAYDISFSCILGLATTFGSAIYAEKGLVWIYVVAQFVIFTVLAQFFYFMLHMNKILAILIAITLALVITRGVHPAYPVIKLLRATWRNQFNNNPQYDAPVTELEATEETDEGRHQSAANLHVSVTAEGDHQSAANPHLSNE